MTRKQEGGGKLESFSFISLLHMFYGGQNDLKVKINCEGESEKTTKKDVIYTCLPTV